jgi:hypothetical protein
VRASRGAPVIPNPSKQITRKESAGWTIASHDASGVCFEGKYTSVDHPVSKARLIGNVSLWDDAHQAEATVPKKDLELVSFQPAPPEPALCEAKQQRVVVDRAGRAIGAIEEPVQVPCTRYSADVRTCAPRLSLADASGKYVALTLGDVSAAWHLQ